VNILDSFQSGWKAWLAGLPVPLMYMGKNALWDESNMRKKQWYVNKKKTHRMWWCLPFYLSQNRVPRLTVSRQILKCERQGNEKVREEIGGGILNTLTKCWVVCFKEKRKKTGDALRIRKSVNILPRQSPNSSEN